MFKLLQNNDLFIYVNNVRLFTKLDIGKHYSHESRQQVIEQSYPPFRDAIIIGCFVT